MSPKNTSRSGRQAGGTGGGGHGGWFTPARITFLVLLALTLIFIFQNTRKVRVRLLIPEVVMPLYLALLATTILGALCGALFLRRRNR
ncbi:DUF1049 domain-containing protein [Streptomyces sp. NPDC057445]|uniref:DUF1049 domain-containing protein n=1 Tax=Streptomyces sp. NPDC057445 TaxID=3346136 RepID=UPI00369257DA